MLYALRCRLLYILYSGLWNNGVTVRYINIYGLTVDAVNDGAVKIRSDH